MRFSTPSAARRRAPGHASLGRALRGAALACCLAASATADAQTLQPLGTYATGLYNQSAAEIVAYDAERRRVFFVNAAQNTVNALDVTVPSAPALLFSIDLSPYGGGANSVAVSPLGYVAVAVEASVKTDPGQVVLFSPAGTFLAAAPVGALPDALAVTPDGRTVVVACEGEPNNAYTVDPEGEVWIVRVERTGETVSVAEAVRVGFTDFNAGGPRHSEIADDPSILITGPGATVAQDLEPEYVAISPDGTRAFVSLQENNAIAVIDLAAARVERLFGQGLKDHAVAGNGFDPSDRDGGINIGTWPVLGMYQADALAAFEHEGQVYLVTANEGDARDYAGFSDEPRLGSLSLDPAVFPNADALRADAALGRLRVSRAAGDTNGDGLIDRIMAFGARSFSVYTAEGALVYDSGDEMERVTAARLPGHFNANHTNNTRDARSPAKGPEPEAVAVGVVDGRRYAFIGLERIGGIFVYDITAPAAPVFVDYVNNRDFSVTPGPGVGGDLGLEALVFVPAAESPNGQPLVIASNEVSGTVTLFQFSPPAVRAEAAPRPGTLTLLAAPNPVSDRLRLRAALPAPAEVTLRLYDVHGRLVLGETRPLGPNDAALEVSVAALAPGVYLAQLEAAEPGGARHRATTRVAIVR
ncbi:MAG: choice-of-anchor I family protein [Rubricoccaceae bacterium]